MILINAPLRVKDAVAAIRRSLLTGEATVQYHTIEVYLFSLIITTLLFRMCKRLVVIVFVMSVGT